ncbi:MAG TPA: hypothetical protein VFT59_02970 [Candidatus Saccharimonadales bacterium]|nr:hypothetical protein [Candidatus Saccharimonadales bacterium]
MRIEISDAALAGMATGAATMVVPVAILAGMGAVMESVMSLGSSGGFLKKLTVGTAVYAPVGALTGLPLYSQAIPGGWRLQHLSAFSPLSA